MSPLEWELNWVVEHPERYEGPLHQRAVCENIKKRYRHSTIMAAASKWAERPTTGHVFELRDALGIPFKW